LGIKMSIVDHVNLPVKDLGRSRRFYEQALEPLGYRFLMQDGDAVGFGIQNWNFGLTQTEISFPPMHLAFIAESQEHVRRFYAAALRAGGRTNGEPGLRPQYHPAYFSAFVLDPDGHNIEAVHRGQ
jgi:catechol 2,3-dioxygenase-like lactoylglutathione lyase family enzyme